jgi:formylglycine-generating enzyme required for sulfatase activity
MKANLWCAGGFFLFALVSVMGQTSHVAFFRIASPTNAVITEFDPAAGTISWSNGVAGVTNQVQRSFDLAATNGWADYVLLVSTGAVACTERILDFNPPEGMVFIPGGYNYGNDPDFGPYTLSVSTFYMDRTEVTKAQWDEVYIWATHADRGTNVYTFDNVGSGKAANHPVHTVNWYDCVKWCNARSEKEGRTTCYTVSGSTYKTGQSLPDCNFSANGYRLPTNTEWEYAARGGLAGKRFPWGDTITHGQANYHSSTLDTYDTSSTRGYHPLHNDGVFPYTSPAGSFASNGYRLHDMIGNVWEWCWDESGSLRGIRCVRGGSWGDYAYDLRCCIEYWPGPDYADYSLGFRAVCR